MGLIRTVFLAISLSLVGGALLGSVASAEVGPAASAQVDPRREKVLVGIALVRGQGHAADKGVAELPLYDHETLLG